MNKYCFQFLKESGIRNKNIEADSYEEAVNKLLEITKEPHVSWYHKRFDSPAYHIQLNNEFPQGFDVCGTTVSGSKFSMHYSNSMNAFCINLWRGSVFGIRKYISYTGKLVRKRTLLKRVYN